MINPETHNRNRPRNTEHLSYVCSHCGIAYTPTHLPRSPFHQYCSSACYNAAGGTLLAQRRRTEIANAIPWQERPQYTNYQGYLMVNIGGTSKFVHRLVMEEQLGRPLTPNETVHHRNGIKADNSPENLAVVLWKAHRGFVTCPHCGETFGLK